MQLTQYYDQMKQSILENGKYVDALLETAEAVYTVNLTDDKLEAAYFHGMDRSIEVEMEVPVPTMNIVKREVPVSQKIPWRISASWILLRS